MAQVAAGVTENSRTVLQTQLLHTYTKKPVYIYNVHLTAYSTNIARIKQIKRMGEILKKHETSPVLIAGDMNYPYRRKKLETILAEFGLSEATKNLQYTSIQNYLNMFIMKVKLDYIFYKNMKHSYTEHVSSCHSDHYPICSTFSFA
jgi:endonuclease/exonuclease/phosphatase (EEP) superfamily protein YafD